MSEESKGSPPSNEGYKRAARMMGIASGLGLEMAALVAGGAFLGEWAAERWGLGSWVTLVLVGVAGLIFVVHVRYLLAGRRGDVTSPDE